MCSNKQGLVTKHRRLREVAETESLSHTVGACCERSFAVAICLSSQVKRKWTIATSSKRAGQGEGTACPGSCLESQHNSKASTRLPGLQREVLSWTNTKPWADDWISRGQLQTAAHSYWQASSERLFSDKVVWICRKKTEYGFFMIYCLKTDKEIQDIWT